jgi:murein DD-endopeptidase MepM/ murein hydrolase activator NlpD
MKATKLITLTAFVFWLSLPLHAQFNTIGTIRNKRINTTNPPKSHQALTDSIVVADSISESKSTNIEGSGQTIDSSMSNHDLMSLVALPLKKIHVSSGFGMRMHPIYHKRILHNGIDLSARYENVYSIFSGTVIRVGQDNRSGKFVTVRTGNYTISYCHLSQPFVKENDYVNAGMSIAISGNTGASTGPHLHLTTKKDGKAFDPTILLNIIQSVKD